MKLKNGIILNKIFSGQWLNDESNIAHEIINFLLSDDSQHYIYNIPYGICPNEIWINGSNNDLLTGKEKYNVKYLILADKFLNNQLNIKYVIELKEKLHNYHLSKKNETEKQLNKNKNKELIKKLDIKYNGSYLYKYFNENDGTQFHLTFKANKMYKAVSALTIKINYNFQRNKGYIFDDKNNDDYNNIKKLIEESISNKKLEIYKPSKVNDIDQINLYEQKTFLDFSLSQNNEQIFTNILFEIFSWKNTLNFFIDSFAKNKSSNLDILKIKFNIKREEKINKGRMDIFATSNKINVIIENKIDSNLNGVDKENKISQLSTYYKWSIENTNRKPICFVIAPNYKYNDLIYEINNIDPNMKDIYQIIKFGDIAKLLEKLFNNNHFKNFEYEKYIKDFINALYKHSYSSKDKYSIKFLKAIKTN